MAANKNDDKNLLKDFAMWVTAKYSMPISEKLIEAEIKTFLNTKTRNLKKKG